MSDRAPSRAPAEAAAEAVKAYIRMNRANLAADGELLALLLPERFAASEVRDLQRYRHRSAGRRECGLARRTRRIARRARPGRQLGESVRRFMLDLLDARSFEEAIAMATGAAPAFGAEHAALCVESEDGVAPTGTRGVRLDSARNHRSHSRPDGMRAILAGGGEFCWGPGGGDCRSLAVFRLRIGRDAPAALYVLGAANEGSLEGEESPPISAFLRARWNGRSAHGSICRNSETGVARQRSPMSAARARTRCAPMTATISRGFSISCATIKAARRTNACWPSSRPPTSALSSRSGASEGLSCAKACSRALSAVRSFFRYLAREEIVENRRRPRRAHAAHRARACRGRLSESDAARALEEAGRRRCRMAGGARCGAAHPALRRGLAHFRSVESQARRRALGPSR